MKSFIFVFFMLAGNSHWEAEAGGEGFSTLSNLVTEIPGIVTKLQNLECEISKADTAEEILEIIHAFRKDITSLLATSECDCDFLDILGLKLKEFAEITLDNVEEVVRGIHEACDSIGLFQTVSQLLCNPTECVNSILKLTGNALKGLKCKSEQGPDEFCEALDDLKCFPPGTPVHDLAEHVKALITDTILKNDAVNGVLHGVLCALKDVVKTVHRFVSGLGVV